MNSRMAFSVSPSCCIPRRSCCMRSRAHSFLELCAALSRQFFRFWLLNKCGLEWLVTNRSSSNTSQGIFSSSRGFADTPDSCSLSTLVSYCCFSCHLYSRVATATNCSGGSDNGLPGVPSSSFPRSGTSLPSNTGTESLSDTPACTEKEYPPTHILTSNPMGTPNLCHLVRDLPGSYQIPVHHGRCSSCIQEDSIHRKIVHKSSPQWFLQVGCMIATKHGWLGGTLTSILPILLARKALSLLPFLGLY